MFELSMSITYKLTTTQRDGFFAGYARGLCSGNEQTSVLSRLRHGTHHAGPLLVQKAGTLS